MSGTVKVVGRSGRTQRRDDDGAAALTEILHVRLSAEDVERLNNAAAFHRVHVSAFAREAIRLALALSRAAP